jgi:putative endonuclease
LVERLVWDQEVAGSNPVTPIFFPRENMFHVYVLRSAKTGRRYVGSCEDIDDRLHRHNNGESKATKHGIPWVLLQVEEFPTRAMATRRERFYKTGRGRDKLDRLQ